MYFLMLPALPVFHLSLSQTLMTYCCMEKCEHFKGLVVYTAWQEVYEIQLLERHGLRFMLVENNFHTHQVTANGLFMIVIESIALSITSFSLQTLCQVLNSFLWLSFSYDTERNCLSWSSSGIIFTNNFIQ